MEHDNVVVLKNGADVLAGFTAVAAVVNWLPETAAALTVVWTTIRIYDYFENRVRKSRSKISGD